MLARTIRPMLLAVASAPEPCADCDIRQKSVCSAVSDRDLHRLASITLVKDYPKGKIFIEEGEPATDFFNVTSGTVKLFKMLPDGRQQITGFATVGHFLGLGVADTYTFSAEAIEPVTVCRFSRSKLTKLLDDFPALEKRLLETACNELVMANNQILMLGRKTARERVASFLVSWSESTSPCDPPAARLHLPMTRGEIADHLGLTIETVSRTFSRFRAEGRIRTPTTTDVVLIDRPWLEHVAAGEG